MRYQVEPSKIKFISTYGHVISSRFCPGVQVHKGITIVLSLFRSHWLAVVYCLVLCSGPCEPVHEDSTILYVCYVSLPTGARKMSQEEIPQNYTKSSLLQILFPT